MGSILFIFVLTIGIGFLSTSGTEKQPYRVIKSYDDFEVRFYPSAIMASIKGKGNYRDFSGWAFRRLAGYIFGNNDKKMKIAMTSPVRMHFDQDTSEMSFMMPSRYVREDVPDP